MKCWKRITSITELNSIRRRRHECIVKYWRREHECIALQSWNDQDQHQHWTKCLNKHSWSRWSRCIYQVHMSTAWHWNQDLQWHDSNVEWHQQDQHWIESYQHWVESYTDNIERCLNAFIERNEEKEHNYTSFRSDIKSTKHFNFERSILEVDQAIWLVFVWKFKTEYK